MHTYVHNERYDIDRFKLVTFLLETTILSQMQAHFISGCQYADFLKFLRTAERSVTFWNYFLRGRYELHLGLISVTYDKFWWVQHLLYLHQLFGTQMKQCITLFNSTLGAIQPSSFKTFMYRPRHCTVFIVPLKIINKLNWIEYFG